MFDEVKEMIDATVYENGNGEVTAKNLNLAMHGVVDATEEKIEEVKGDVTALEERVEEIGPLRVWMPVEDMSTELTPEQIAENVATYNEIVKGEPVSVILCQGGSVDGKTVAGTIPTTASYTDFGGNKTVVLLANQIVARELVTIMGQLYSDGSVAMFTETFEVPAASSGPLYLSQDSEHNKEIYNTLFSALTNEKNCPQVVLTDVGVSASSVAVWIDNNTFVNGVGMSFYIPAAGEYTNLILSPDGELQ